MFRSVLSFLTVILATAAFVVLCGAGLALGLVTGVEETVLAGMAAIPAPGLRKRTTRPPFLSSDSQK